MSTKTVAEKLLIKPNTPVWSSSGPLLDRVGPLPEGVRVVSGLDEATTAIVFADSASSLRTSLKAHKKQLTKPGSLWVAYPKANKADINRDSVWPIVCDYGMRPIGQVAIDEVWSALRFRPNAAGEAPFTGGQK
jgi:hypothetical protein